MKTVALEETTLDRCIKQAQKDRVIVMRKGKPVALIVGTDGLDAEQWELCSSPKFWKLIEARRKQKTIPLEELERRLAERDRRAREA
jgi:antitoxin (DNA-binding transcriptional repressor) of toxin-antitoxin stability system